MAVTLSYLRYVARTHDKLVEAARGLRALNASSSLEYHNIAEAGTRRAARKVGVAYERAGKPLRALAWHKKR